MTTHSNETDPTQLAHQFEKGAHVTEAVAESEGLKENIAQAVVSVRESLAYKALTAAWNVLPAKAQRLMLTNHSALGAFLLKYFPMAHPEAYFVPGQLAAAFIQFGLLSFKPTDEETATMKEVLGVDATEAQKTAYWAKMQEELVAQIITPGEGYTELLESKPAASAAAINPELEPFLLIGRAGGMLNHARDGFLESIRNRVSELQIEAQEATAVLREEEKEHDAVAEDLRPEVQIPFANNTDHFEEAHKRAA